MGNHKNEKTKEELFEFIKEIISKKDQKKEVDEDSDDDGRPFDFKTRDLRST